MQFHYKKAHGLSEDALPRIERSIAYTFDAYAGEGADGNGKASKDDTKKPQRTLRKGRKSSAKSQKLRSFEVPPAQSENQLETLEAPHAAMERESLECPEPHQVFFYKSEVLFYCFLIKHFDYYPEALFSL